MTARTFEQFLQSLVDSGTDYWVETITRDDAVLVLELYKKARMWEQAKDAMVKAIKDSTEGSENIVISVGDVNAESEASAISERLKEEVGPKEIIRTNVGIVVGSHLGVGGLGITYHT